MKIKAKKKKFVNAEIVEIATTARAENMTYGKYVAMQQILREREAREERRAYEQETGKEKI